MRYDIVLESSAGGASHSNTPHQVTYDVVAWLIRPNNAGAVIKMLLYMYMILSLVLLHTLNLQMKQRQQTQFKMNMA